jgi:organic hydroperoxide reductase OsmC/OhrA
VIVRLLFTGHRSRIGRPRGAQHEIDLHQADGGYFISARFNVSLPRLDRDIAKSLIQEAEQICTYSKATRGNIDVVFNLV